MAQRERTALCVAVLALIAFVATACGGGNETSAGGTGTQGSTERSCGDFKIGASLSLTGTYAPFDGPIADGMRFAAKQINDGGGIDKCWQIKLSFKDNKWDTATAVQQTQELVDEGNEALVVACENSQAIATGTVAQEAHIPALSSCNTGPKVTASVGDYMFIHLFSDNTQASDSAKYACDQGYKSVYLLRSPDGEFLNDAPLYFADAFNHYCGGKVAGEGSFKVGQTDFASVVGRIKGVSPAPDVIYSGIYVPDATAFMTQLRAGGVNTPVLTADGNDDVSFREAGGKAVEGVVHTVYALATPGSKLEEVVQQYEQSTGKKAEAPQFVGAGWDIINLFATAVQTAGTTDPTAVRDALQNVKDFDGTLGKTSYTPENHTPAKQVCLVKIVNGEKELIDCQVPDYIPDPDTSKLTIVKQ
jgi:branched-chain amino acid transport system substrate-binding protein